MKSKLTPVPFEPKLRLKVPKPPKPGSVMFAPSTKYWFSSPEAPLIDGLAPPAPALSATPGAMLITDDTLRPIGAFVYIDEFNTPPTVVLLRSMVAPPDSLTSICCAALPTWIEKSWVVWG